MNDLRLTASDSAWLKRAHIDAEMDEYERGYSDASQNLSDLAIELSIRSERLKKWNRYLLSACALFGIVATTAIAALMGNG